MPCHKSRWYYSRSWQVAAPMQPIRFPPRSPMQPSGQSWYELGLRGREDQYIQSLGDCEGNCDFESRGPDPTLESMFASYVHAVACWWKTHKRRSEVVFPEEQTRLSRTPVLLFPYALEGHRLASQAAVRKLSTREYQIHYFRSLCTSVPVSV